MSELWGGVAGRCITKGQGDWKELPVPVASGRRADRSVGPRSEEREIPHLFRVILPVSDIERAQRFYSAVLGLPGTRVSPGRHYFDCEGTILACFDPLADGDGYPATPIAEPIYLAVADLRATFDACRVAGATFSQAAPPGVGPLGEIARRPWGEESFYASDPFGNPVCFVSRASVFTG